MGDFTPKSIMQFLDNLWHDTVQLASSSARYDGELETFVSASEGLL